MVGSVAQMVAKAGGMLPGACRGLRVLLDHRRVWHVRRAKKREHAGERVDLVGEELAGNDVDGEEHAFVGGELAVARVVPAGVNPLDRLRQALVADAEDADLGGGHAGRRKEGGARARVRVHAVGGQHQ